MLDSEKAQRGDGIDLHLAYSATLDFHEAHGRWPQPRSKQDADELLALAQAASDRHSAAERADGRPTIWAQRFTEPDYLATFENAWGVARPLDAARVRRFSLLFGAELTGFCAYLGGAIAQEVHPRPSIRF